MNLYEIFIKICLVVLFACAANNLNAQSGVAVMTPIQFNDQLTGITDGLFSRGQEWGRRFNEAYKSKDFSSLRPYRESLEQFVTVNIAKVLAMKDVNNSKDLRMAIVGFLQFEKKMVNQAFTPLEKLSPSATAAEINLKLKELKEFSALENAELQKVNIAQETYAKSNGFRVETAEEAKKP